jgi:hypothetical protein
VIGAQLGRRVRIALVPLIAALGVAAAVLLAPGSGHADTLSIAVSGNHFVNGAGQTVRLLGADHPSFEYACIYGYGYNDGQMDATDAAAIASWHATAVRIPLNEDCWLGTNNEPSNSQNPQPPLTVSGYRAAVQAYVSALHAAGLYAILDLHWTAPGGFAADGQRSMPDTQSTAFWTSVASTFASDPAVVFDVFNEPYSPALVNDPSHPVDWNCWLNGGCTVPSANDQSTPDPIFNYTAVGMQALVNAIRATGARQPIMVGGLAYANDLSGWLAHEPNDPLGQLAASFHVYQGEACATQACWDQQVAPVAAQVPVVTGEFDQDVCAPSTFDNDYMTWADAHGISYLAWGWWVLTPQEISDAGCSAYYLRTDAAGTPAAPNGVNLHDHLAALFAAGGTTPTQTAPTTSTPTTTPTTNGGGKPVAPISSFAAKLAANGKTLAITLKAPLASTGSISARTVKTFPVKGSKKKKPVTVGTAKISLAAGKAKTVNLTLSSASRTLLRKLKSLKVQLVITLSNAQAKSTGTSRTVTLKAPKKG